MSNSEFYFITMSNTWKEIKRLKCLYSSVFGRRIYTGCFMNTVCNRIRYTNLKIYCEQTNNDITAQFVTECFSTVQVLRHLKQSTRGHHWLVRYRRPSKWRILLTWKRKVCVAVRKKKIIQRRWLNGDFIQIIIQKHLLKFIYKWHTSFAETGCIYAKKNIRAGEQVTRVCSEFVRRFFFVRNNSQVGKAGNCVISFTWQRGRCFVSNCLSGLQISTAARLSDRRLEEENWIWVKVFSVTRLPFIYHKRWIAII
jgi:hypothetical protein